MIVALSRDNNGHRLGREDARGRATRDKKQPVIRRRVFRAHAGRDRDALVPTRDNGRVRTTTTTV